MLLLSSAIKIVNSTLFKASANGIKLGKVWGGRGIYKLFLLLWNMRKRGQFQIAFGMIFSIILIVAFIVVAIIAINTFLGVSCSIETGSFINDLDNEIIGYIKGLVNQQQKNLKLMDVILSMFVFMTLIMMQMANMKIL